MGLDEGSMARYRKEGFLFLLGALLESIGHSAACKAIFAIGNKWHSSMFTTDLNVHYNVLKFLNVQFIHSFLDRD
jgi:hypothetical protein